jgi:hypothetical protein
MAQRPDEGFALLPMLLSAFLGLLLALLGSFAIVQAGTAKPAAPVTKPLITYDSQ